MEDARKAVTAWSSSDCADRIALRMAMEWVEQATAARAYGAVAPSPINLIGALETLAAAL
jgi:hypothetical protein